MLLRSGTSEVVPVVFCREETGRAGERQGGRGDELNSNILSLSPCLLFTLSLAPL